MSTGKINVAVENIFPLIKKFLYSDHEIFLRELISNATDATTKLQHLSSLGEIKGDLGDLTIEVKVDKKAKKIHIIDRGIGMTQEEVQKYINEVAFSGAEEFLEQYKDSAKDSGIIGHFGLGFYSAFMVAEKVEIKTQSHKEEPAAHWVCDGSPEYTLETIEKDAGAQKSFFTSIKTPRSFWKKRELENSCRSTTNSCPSLLSLAPKRKPFLYPRVLLKMRNPKRLPWTTSSTTLTQHGPKNQQTSKKKTTNPSTENSIPCSLKSPYSIFI